MGKLRFEGRGKQIVFVGKRGKHDGVSSARPLEKEIKPTEKKRGGGKTWVGGGG